MAFTVGDCLEKYSYYALQLFDCFVISDENKSTHLFQSIYFHPQAELKGPTKINYKHNIELLSVSRVAQKNYSQNLITLKVG